MMMTRKMILVWIIWNYVCTESDNEEYGGPLIWEEEEEEEIMKE